MTLSETQRVSIRQYLGYADTHRLMNTMLEGACDVIGDRPDSQAMVESILDKLDVIEEELSDVSRSGVVKADGEVELEESRGGASSHHRAVRAAGRRLVTRLSTIMGVPIKTDIFSEWGYGGRSLGNGSFII